MWNDIFGIYLLVGLVWVCETGLYWYVQPDDEVDKMSGLFAALFGWPYQFGKGIVRKCMGLKFFKEID